MKAIFYLTSFSDSKGFMTVGPRPVILGNVGRFFKNYQVEP